MHNEVVRAVTDWLSGKTLDYAGLDQGVNRQLVTTVPRDTGDAAVEPVAQFEDVTRDDAAAHYADPVNYPAIRVFPGEPAQAEGETRANQAGVTGAVRDMTGLGIIVRYYRKDANTATGIQNTGYTLRAVLRSLREFNRSANAPGRTRNNVTALTMTQVTFGPAQEHDGTTGCTGAVIARFTVRDLAA